MLQAYTFNTSGVEVDENTAIVFENIAIETGCTSTTTEGTSTINLNKPGYYQVTLNAYGNVTEATTDGVLGIAMFRDGEEVDYASAFDTTTAPARVRSIGFTTIVKILPSCPAIFESTKLTFVNTGSKSTYYNTNVVVTKLC